MKCNVKNVPKSNFSREIIQKILNFEAIMFDLNQLKIRKNI